MSWAIEMSPQELQQRMEAGEQIALIDVREPEEHAIARLATATLLPMQTVPSQLQTLEALSDEAPLAILCHHGVRSLNVAVWLRRQGVENCFSIEGGLDRWSREVDPAIPRY